MLDRAVREPRPAEASRLQLQPDTLVLALRRLRVADDEPMAIEEAIFPAALAALLQNADLEHRSLHDTLVEGGHVPTMGRARLGAEAAGPDDAALLGVPRRRRRCWWRSA